jgi:hypothetical protein
MTKLNALLTMLGLAAAVSGCARPQPPDLAANLQVATQLREAIGGDTAASESAETKEVAEPTGWATIKGRFRLTAPITPGEFAINKDTGVCGTTAKDLSVITGPENGLKNVLVYLSTKVPSLEEPWVHPSYADQAQATVEFDQKHCVFLHHVFAMRSTQTLKVLNSDPVGHNTSINDFAYNAIIPPGGNDDNAGVKELREPASVSCSIHPWMQAFIMATPTPYYAVTDDAGNFEIKNVPAGVDLEFRVWQEKVKYVAGGSVNGANANWPKGRMKVTLANDDELNLDVVLDAAKFQ